MVSKKKAKKPSSKRQPSLAQICKALAGIELRLNMFEERRLCSVVSTRGAPLPKVLDTLGVSTRLGEHVNIYRRLAFVELVASYKEFVVLVKKYKLKIRCNYHLEAIEQCVRSIKGRYAAIEEISDGKWNRMPL